MIQVAMLDATLDPLRVDAICAPAGVEIGAVTPEEIAVSVLAGLIQAYRGDVPVASVGSSEAVEAKATGGCCATDTEVPATAAPTGLWQCAQLMSR